MSAYRNGVKGAKHVRGLNPFSGSKGFNGLGEAFKLLSVCQKGAVVSIELCQGGPLDRNPGLPMSIIMVHNL